MMTAMMVRLRRARRLAGLPMRGLDRLAGLALGHTSLIESGRRANIGIDTIAPIAEVLGVSIDWLVTGAGVAPTEASVRSAVAAATTKREATAAGRAA